MIQTNFFKKLYYQYHWSTYTLDKRIREGNISKLETFIIGKLFRPFYNFSLSLAVQTGNYKGLHQKLVEILPDFNVESSEWDFDQSEKNQRRIYHVCQCQVFLKFMDLLPEKEEYNIVDIGDNSGKQLTYFKNLFPDKKINTLSVNLDPDAVEELRKRGFEAILCRAEDLDLGDREIDVFCTFNMIEHLHDPVGFLYKLAKKGNSDYLIVGAPYLPTSRVGLWDIKYKKNKTRTAETTHVFELCPNDWELLFQHAGWEIIDRNITYYYPFRKTPIGWIFASVWKLLDVEGQYCVLLKRNTEIMNTYSDWAY